MKDDFFGLKKGLLYHDFETLSTYKKIKIDIDDNNRCTVIAEYNDKLFDTEDYSIIGFDKNGIIESVKIISKKIELKDLADVLKEIRNELILNHGKCQTVPEFFFLLNHVIDNNSIYCIWDKKSTKDPTKEVFPFESIILKLEKLDDGYIWVIECKFQISDNVDVKNDENDKDYTFDNGLEDNTEPKPIVENSTESITESISAEDLIDDDKTFYQNEVNYNHSDNDINNEQEPSDLKENKSTKHTNEDLPVSEELRSQKLIQRNEFSSQTESTKTKENPKVTSEKDFWKSIFYLTICMVGFVAFWIFVLLNPIKQNKSVVNDIYYGFYFLYTIASCILPVRVLYKFFVFKKDEENARQYLLDETITMPSETKSIWQAYKSTFFDKSFGLKNKTRASADLYFNYESVIGSMSKKPIIPWFKLIGGSFLGLGILGTFIGFSIGLGSIDFRNESTTKMMEGIEILVKNGLATAFNTSIVGVLLSLLYNFGIYHPLIKKLNDYFEDLSDELDKEFYVSETEALMQYTMVTGENSENVTFSQSLRFIVENMNKQTEALNSFNDNLADKIANINESVKASLGTFVNGVGSEVKEVVVENVHEEMTELKASISDAAKDFATAAEKLFDTPDIIEKANSELKSYLEDTRTSFSEMLAENEKTNKTILNEVVVTIKEQLSERFSEFSQALENTLNNAQKAADLLSGTPEKIEKVENALFVKETEVADKFDIASNKLLDISRGMTDYLNTMQNGIATVLHDLSNAEKNVKELLDSAKMHEDNSGRNLTSVITETSRMLDGFKAVDINLKNIFESIGNEIVKYNTTVGATLDQYLASFEKGSTVFSNSVTSQMQEFETTIDNLSANLLDVQKSSNQFGEQIIKLGEILKNKKED